MDGPCAESHVRRGGRTLCRETSFLGSEPGTQAVLEEVLARMEARDRLLAAFPVSKDDVQERPLAGSAPELSARSPLSLPVVKMHVLQWLLMVISYHASVQSQNVSAPLPPGSTTAHSASATSVAHQFLSGLCGSVFLCPSVYL